LFHRSYRLPATSYWLLLQPKLLHKRAVRAPVRPLEVLQVLATVGNKPQKTAARVLILAIFIQMGGNLLDSAGQNGDLDLRGARILVVPLALLYLILLLALRKHRATISHSGASRKAQFPFYSALGVLVSAAGADSTLRSFTSKTKAEFAGMMTLPSASLTSSDP